MDMGSEKMANYTWRIGSLMWIKCEWFRTTPNKWYKRLILNEYIWWRKSTSTITFIFRHHHLVGIFVLNINILFFGGFLHLILFLLQNVFLFVFFPILVLVSCFGLSEFFLLIFVLFLVLPLIFGLFSFLFNWLNFLFFL